MFNSDGLTASPQPRPAPPGGDWLPPGAVHRIPEPLAPFLEALCPIAPPAVARSHETVTVHSRVGLQYPGAIRVGWILPYISFGGVCRGIMTLLERCLPEQIQFSGIAIQQTKVWHDSLAERISRFCPVYVPTDCEERSGGLIPVQNFVSGVQRVVDDSDVLQLWGPFGAAAGLLKQVDWKGKPVVLHSHGSCEWTRQMLKPLLPFATDYMAVSRSAIQPFPEEVQGQVVVVHNGVDQERCSSMLGRERIRAMWGVAEGEILIGYHGRLSPEKRPESAAVAAACLGRPYRSIYIGQSWTSEKGRQLVQSQDPRALCFETLDHIGDFLAGIDVAILNSQTEGMSQSMLECWMAGVPVVATAVGAVNELEDRFGRLVVRIPHTIDPTMLATAAQQACSADFRQIVTRAQQVARTHFTASRMAQNFTEYVRQVIRRPVRLGIMTHGLARGGGELWIASLLKHLDPDRVICTGVAITSTSGTDPRIVAEIARVAPIHGIRAPGPSYRSPQGREYSTAGFTAVYETPAEAVAAVAGQSDVLLSWGSPEAHRLLQSHSLPTIAVSQTTVKEESPQPIVGTPYLVGGSQAALAYFEGRGAGHLPQTVIYNGADQTRIQPVRGRAWQRHEWGVTDETIVVGYLGRQSQEKGYFKTAEAIAVLPERFQAVYYGQSQLHFGQPCPKLMQWIRKHVTGRVQVRLPVHEMGDVLAGIDVLVSSSHREAFGLVIAEAWLSGVPVVSTPVGIAAEGAVRHGSLAILVSADPQPEELAEAIRRAAGPEGRAIATHARQVAEAEYTADKMARRWEEFLEGVVKGATERNSSHKRMSP